MSWNDPNLGELAAEHNRLGEVLAQWAAAPLAQALDPNGLDPNPGIAPIGRHPL
jgi:hypothetical protein